MYIFTSRMVPSMQGYTPIGDRWVPLKVLEKPYVDQFLRNYTLWFTVYLQKARRVHIWKFALLFALNGIMRTL